MVFGLIPVFLGILGFRIQLTVRSPKEFMIRSVCTPKPAARAGWPRPAGHPWSRFRCVACCATRTTSLTTTPTTDARPTTPTTALRGSCSAWLYIALSRPASVAQYGHLSRMAVFGYLTRARDARPRRWRPPGTGDRACGVCSRRGGARYAGSTRATQARIWRSRSDSMAGSSSPASVGRDCCCVSAWRHARTTESTSPCHGKCELPCSRMNVAPGIAAATSRPSRYGTVVATVYDRRRLADEWKVGASRVPNGRGPPPRSHPRPRAASAHRHGGKSRTAPSAQRAPGTTRQMRWRCRSQMSRR